MSGCGVRGVRWMMIGEAWGRVNQLHHGTGQQSGAFLLRPPTHELMSPARDVITLIV